MHKDVKSTTFNNLLFQKAKFFCIITTLLFLQKYFHSVYYLYLHVHNIIQNIWAYNFPITHKYKIINHFGEKWQNSLIILCNLFISFEYISLLTLHRSIYSESSINKSWNWLHFNSYATILHHLESVWAVTEQPHLYLFRSRTILLRSSANCKVFFCQLFFIFFCSNHLPYKSQ